MLPVEAHVGKYENLPWFLWNIFVQDLRSQLGVSLSRLVALNPSSRSSHSLSEMQSADQDELLASPQLCQSKEALTLDPSQVAIWGDACWQRPRYEVHL